jgi:hypothetical protein
VPPASIRPTEPGCAFEWRTSPATRSSGSAFAPAVSWKEPAAIGSFRMTFIVFDVGRLITGWRAVNMI